MFAGVDTAQAAALKKGIVLNKVHWGLPSPLGPGANVVWRKRQIAHITRAKGEVGGEAILLQGIA